MLTLHCRLTQRWEASLWLSGKQLYLGGFEREEDAARAYDIAALACKGPMVATNFDASEYTEELDAVRGCSKVCPHTNVEVLGRTSLRALQVLCFASHNLLAHRLDCTATECCWTLRAAALRSVLLLSLIR